MTIWQVGGGEWNRFFGRELVRFGVALIGPGWPGRWEPGIPDDDFEGGWVRRFATEPAVGDVILLRSGRSTVHAIGLIASDYMYLPQFEDVNGWDLQHARQVRWFELPKPHQFENPAFGYVPGRFSQVKSAEVVDYALCFIRSPPSDWQAASLPPLPNLEPDLVSPPESLASLIALATEINGRYWDRKQFGEHPTEHELVGHFVIPFLQAMGWSPELIGVEWKGVDICVFRELPRSSNNIQFIIEAKRLGEGVEGALEQAKRYAVGLGTFCDLIVTDGLRYRLYEYDENKKDFMPSAYANLLRLKQSSEKLFARMKRT